MPKESDQSSKRICLGRIAAPHGVRGLVKILPYGDDPSLLSHVTDYKITLKNPLGKYVLAQIEGVDDRNASEALKGTELFVDRGVLPDIYEDDSFYVEDLIGLTCIGDNGEEIGRVKAVENYGAGDLLDIRLRGGADTLIPFKDEFVPDVNIAEGFIKISADALNLMGD